MGQAKTGRVTVAVAWMWVAVVWGGWTALAGQARWPSADEIGLVSLPEGWEVVSQPGRALPSWSQRRTFRSAAHHAGLGAWLVLAVEPPESDLVRAERMREFVNRSAAELQGVPGLEVWGQDVIVREGQVPVGVVRLKIGRHLLPEEVGGGQRSEHADENNIEYMEQVNLFVAGDEGFGALYLYRPWQDLREQPLAIQGEDDPLLSSLISTFSPPPAAPPPPTLPASSTPWWLMGGALTLLTILGLWRYTRWQRDSQRAQWRQHSADSTAPASAARSSDSPPSPAWEDDLLDLHPVSAPALGATSDKTPSPSEAPKISTKPDQD